MPSRFALLFALVLVPWLAVAASPVRAEDSAPGSPDVTITLRNGLSDRDVTVPLGGIVRFVNRDDDRHRMRSRSGDGFDTGNLEPGESVQIRLSSGGTFTYIDERDDDDTRYHGRIRVTAKGGDKPTGGAPDKTATIRIGDGFFDPGTTTVEVGATVTFENTDGDEHTATSVGGGGFDSGVLASGATYEKTFSDAGTYDFLCLFHSDMRGTIEVVGNAPGAAPKPTVTPAPTHATPTTDDAIVDIVDLAFEPAEVTVTAGGSVTWTNTGVAPHTATAEDGSFDSATLDSGATFTQTFETPGTFAYICQIHPDMRGTVDVVAAEPPAPAAATLPAPTRTAGPDSPLTPGTILAVALVSIAVVLFARLLAATPRRAPARYAPPD